MNCFCHDRQTEGGQRERERACGSNAVFFPTSPTPHPHPHFPSQPPRAPPFSLSVSRSRAILPHIVPFIQDDGKTMAERTSDSFQHLEKWTPLSSVLLDSRRHETPHIPSLLYPVPWLPLCLSFSLSLFLFLSLSLSYHQCGCSTGKPLTYKETDRAKERKEREQVKSHTDGEGEKNNDRGNLEH